MVDGQILSISLSQAELAYVKNMAERACIGGASQVRSAAERTSTLNEDNLVGQLAQYAGSRWLFGSAHQYRSARHVANLYPISGDGGFDVLGLNVDFKGSLMRGTRPMLDYRLAVRPHERHLHTVYILALVANDYATVHLVGWAADDMLPDQPEQDGPFSGAYTIQARNLVPLPPFRWWQN